MSDWRWSLQGPWIVAASTHVRFLLSRQAPRAVPRNRVRGGAMEVIVERCAGLDVHKDTVMACVRRPGKGRTRSQEVRQFRTFTAGLRELRDWLATEQVTQVAMEATGVYWRPVWHLLEDLPGVELLLVNAHHVKKVPGRKTDLCPTRCGWPSSANVACCAAASCHHRPSPRYVTSPATAKRSSR